MIVPTTMIIGLSPCSLEPLKISLVDPIKIIKLAVILHYIMLCSNSNLLINLVNLVPDMLLRILLQHIIIKTRSGLLVVTHLVANDFFLCWWWRSHVALRLRV